ncbi:hypothetical protein A2U01_0060631, partial [Trifolium medium]|nr:hypothetical protein [Trifolium medium]
IDCVIDSLKETVLETDVVQDVNTSLARENKQGETIPETNVVQSVDTSVAPATVTNVGTSGVPKIVTSETVHNNTTEKEGTHVIAKSGNNLVDYPESNESSKFLAGSKEVSDPEVVIMGNSIA